MNIFWRMSVILYAPYVFILLVSSLLFTPIYWIATGETFYDISVPFLSKLAGSWHDKIFK